MAGASDSDSDSDVTDCANESDFDFINDDEENLY